MDITQTEFVASFPKEATCPRDGRPEFAFIGRSNVGKSSLINMLTGRKGLAKVSGTPGKTQLLNFFLINHAWYLVDLPGYGYARLSKEKQKTLATMIDTYLRQRKTLTQAFVLIDSNIPPTKIDLQFVEGLGRHGIPFSLIFTKTDRISKAQVDRHVTAFFQELEKIRILPPPHFITSSERRTGRSEVLDFIGAKLGIA